MSILVNGSPTEEFCLERGVRQGDPLSPFLFILAAEGLNAIMKEAVDKGVFRSVKIGSNKVIVLHLQYADATIFFEEWNKENEKSLMCILKCFEQVFGLHVNYNKSKLYGVGANEAELRDMARWIRCGVGKFPFMYLGLPIGENMRRVGAWNNVMEKFKNRLADWKAKSMSFGERLTLVKSVLGSLPLYYFSMFRVPLSVIKLLEKIGVRRVGWRRKVNGSIMCGLGNGSGLGTLEGGDRWRWTLQESGDFTARDLTRLIEEKIINADNGSEATIWNKWVPKKVNIFVWRALKGRLPVHEELDRRGIDLDSILCPSCGDVVESCSHCLVMCNFARSVWEKIFCWWKIGNVNAFSIGELFSLNGNASVPSLSSKMWQAVIWTSGYFI
ncbi:reverse transcriptase domain, reverse transcriptase zinc-binding domain protein [Tanacetum coccineum]